MARILTPGRFPDVRDVPHIVHEDHSKTSETDVSLQSLAPLTGRTFTSANEPLLHRDVVIGAPRNGARVAQDTLVVDIDFVADGDTGIDL